MNQLLSRKTWIRSKDEDQEDYIKRLNLQYRQLSDLKLSRGQCYMVRFDEDDIRPMWERQISISQLKEQIRTPHGTKWDCPLCQTHDNWEGLAEIDKNRRYMCRIIHPRYNNGSIEEGGVLKKCPCILKPKRRAYLKFKD